MLGQCKAFVKAVVAKFPLLGWSMWFNEFVFLSRSKAGQDLSKIRKSMDHLRGLFQVFKVVFILFKNIQFQAGSYSIRKEHDLLKKNTLNLWNSRKKEVSQFLNICCCQGRRAFMSRLHVCTIQTSRPFMTVLLERFLIYAQFDSFSKLVRENLW